MAWSGVCFTGPWCYADPYEPPPGLIHEHFAKLSQPWPAIIPGVLQGRLTPAQWEAVRADYDTIMIHHARTMHWVVLAFFLVELAIFIFLAVRFPGGMGDAPELIVYALVLWGLAALLERWWIAQPLQALASRFNGVVRMRVGRPGSSRHDRLRTSGRRIYLALLFFGSSLL
jgi:hypothetical protein